VEVERKMPVICGAVVWVKQLAKLLHSALGLLVTDVCLYYLINDEPLDKLLLHSFTASSSSWLPLFGELMLCKSSASPRCVTEVDVWCFVDVDHTWKWWNKMTLMEEELLYWGQDWCYVSVTKNHRSRLENWTGHGFNKLYFIKL